MTKQEREELLSFARRYFSVGAKLDAHIKSRDAIHDELHAVTGRITELQREEQKLIREFDNLLVKMLVPEEKIEEFKRRRRTTNYQQR